MTDAPETDELATETAADDQADDDQVANDDMVDDDPEALFERNMEAFRSTNPGLYQRLKEHHPVSELVTKENGEKSIQYKDFDLYPEGADTSAQTQTDTFKAHSQRLHLATITSAGLDGHTAWFKRALEKRFEESGFRFTRLPFRDNAYFAIVLGLGLGRHIEPIVDRTGCRVLAIVEPNMDFIYHSLFVHDWCKLMDDFRERGDKIYFFTENDPVELLAAIKSIFRAQNPSSLDGTLMFHHYQSSIFQAINKGLQDELRTAVMGLGFFEDEINMIAQTYKNLESGESRIMRKLHENPGLPAFVVATGPSLDALLPFLKENADKAAILCCGTSIGVLLANGIQPDFWFVLERGKGIYDLVAPTAETYDVSDIRLVGSTTMFPTIPTLFKESILLFRPGLSPAPLFAESSEEIAEIPDPLAANCGLSFALSAGFAEIYFLGVDCGSHWRERAHAKGSWYEQGDIEEDFTDLGLPTKGNFGGTVWTDTLLQWSRENLEKLISVSRGHVFYNLGNGALVKGAAPKHPRTITLPALPRPKAELIDEFVGKYPIFTRQRFETAWDNAAIIDRLPEYCDNLKNIVRDAEDLEDFGYLQETMKVLRPAEVRSPLDLLLRGTVFMSLIVFEFLMNRAVDEDERVSMQEIFKEEYCTLIDYMCDRAIEIFTDVEDGMAWEDDFVDDMGEEAEPVD